MSKTLLVNLDEVHLRLIDRAERAEQQRDELFTQLERMRVALENARMFIACEYSDASCEPDGEWLAKEARPVYGAIVTALTEPSA